MTLSLLLLLSPLLLVALLILLARWTAPSAAGAGLAAALLVTLAGERAPDAAGYTRALGDAAILALSAAAVMLPGLLFTAAATRRGATAALSGWVGSLPLPPALIAALLVSALGPGLESMTGFGVSLVATIPVLMAMLPVATALRLALLGMAIMPWGTLGLAPVVGARLAGLPLEALGPLLPFTSALVLLAAGLRAQSLLPPGMRRILPSLALAAGLILGLSLATQAVGLEPAGMAAGLGLALLFLLLCRAVGQSLPPVPRAAWPFAALVAAVAGLRLVSVLIPPEAHPILQGPSVGFSLLASPGPALLLAALLAGAGREAAAEMRRRALRPVLALGLFLLMAQILRQGGLAEAFAASLGDLGPEAGLGVTALLGAASGYVTGSALGGNALVMAPVAALGQSLGEAPLFAATQTSAAAHAAMGSIPMVAMITSLAGPAHRREEQPLLRFGLGVAAGHALLVGLAALILARA